MPKHMPQLLSAMTPFPYQIDAGQPVADALQMMGEHHIRHLPVVIEGNIESIISDRDIKRAQLIGHRGTAGEGLCVGDISPTACFFADVCDPLDQVLDLMIANHAEALVVLREGAPVGIFTHTDACKALAMLLREHYPADGDGEDDAA